MLLAILLYLALDVCLPSMPGAFVFESADSVESAGTARVRAGSAVPALARHSVALSPRRHDVRGRAVPVRDPARVPRHLTMSRAPRATVDPPPGSEEPH
jgi:hypothetical protein